MFLKIFFLICISCICFYIFFLSKKDDVKIDFNPEISYQLVKNGALLLDVRSKEEYDVEHIEGSIHLPYQEIKNKKSFLDSLSKGNKKKDIVVYCRSGRRSSIAKKELENLGYENVINHGGISSWKK